MNNTQDEMSAVEAYYGFDCSACEREMDFIRKSLADSEREVARLLEIITRAMSELGIPGPGYPAPVANAVEILREAAAWNGGTR